MNPKVLMSIANEVFNLSLLVPNELFPQALVCQRERLLTGRNNKDFKINKNVLWIFHRRKKCAKAKIKQHNRWLGSKRG